MKNKLLFTVFFLMIYTLIFAQDKFADRLIQRNGKVIVCQVREIGDDEIKYIMEGYRDDLIFGIDKNKVESIVFADGREMKLIDSMYGKENYLNQHKNAFKFHFFSPLTNATAFSYERSLKPGRSIEFGIGIIGLGTGDDILKDASGYHMNVGYKLIKDPDFYVKGMRYAHILKGSYIKPEFALSSYSFTKNDWLFGSNGNTLTKEDVLMGAFLINVGKQYVYSDRFLVDWYVGGGYGIFGNNDANNSYHFGFIGDVGNLVVTAGFKIGLLW